MPSRPLVLFDDLGSPRPTTRGVASLVKEGGTEALTAAERRADEARYQEVTCRSALNRVQGMPFDWTLNPYRGCTHGCHYCFARRYHVQFEMNADDEFASPTHFLFGQKMDEPWANVPPPMRLLD